MSESNQLKANLQEVIDSLDGDEAATLVVIGKKGAGAFSNVTATGLQGTIDVLIARLGHLQAEEHGAEKPKDEIEAYCLGAKSMAHAAEEKVKHLKARRNGTPRHVVEEVTEGVAANDTGSKTTH